MSDIKINGVSFEPTAPAAVLSSVGLNQGTAQNTNYILVQTAAPLTKEQKEQLRGIGAEILETVIGDAYVCAYPPADLHPIRVLPFVKWVDVYPKAVKIAPSLLRFDDGRTEATARQALMAMPGALDRTKKTVDIVFHRNVNPAHMAQRVADAAGLPVSALQVTRNKVRAAVDFRHLAAIANIDEVRNVQEVFPNTLFNNIARGILKAPNPPDPGLGDGEVVAVADTGFDTGSTTDVHPAFSNRVLKLYPLARPGKADDPFGHGTHVAGSILGDGNSAALGRIQGTAPKAKLVLQSIADVSGYLNLPADLGDLFRQPYDTDGARIHSNSWGTKGNYTVYDTQAQEVDQFVYEHRDLLICFAAGNYGTDSNGTGKVQPGSVVPPGTAKNCLTVGASESFRPDKTMTYGQGWPSDFPAPPIHDDKTADAPDGMVAFSSRGPTQDGRYKPDIVAPGTYILSARSRATTGTGWELAGDPLYMYDGGTSMATPLVSGCVASVRAFLKASHGMASPSAALLKALIINGADQMKGQYNPSEACTIANTNQGFGRVNLQAVIGPYNQGESLTFIDEGAPLDTGARYEKDLQVPEGARILKVTLVWTDPPGDRLQSDLDLIVTVAGNGAHGNMPAGSTDFDRVNNVEQVVLANPTAGNASVVVSCHAATLGPQSFALVMRVA
jgi:hypothetical protein